MQLGRLLSELSGKAISSPDLRNSYKNQALIEYEAAATCSSGIDEHVAALVNALNIPLLEIGWTRRLRKDIFVVLSDAAFEEIHSKRFLQAYNLVSLLLKYVDDNHDRMHFCLAELGEGLLSTPPHPEEALVVYRELERQDLLCGDQIGARVAVVGQIDALRFLKRDAEARVLINKLADRYKNELKGTENEVDFFVLNRIACYCMDNHDYETAHQFFDYITAAQDKHWSKTQPLLLARLCHYNAEAAGHLGQYKFSISHFLQAERLFESGKDFIGAARSRLYIARASYATEPERRKACLKGLELVGSRSWPTLSDLEVARCLRIEFLINMAEIVSAESGWLSASKYMDEAMKLQRLIHSKEHVRLVQAYSVWYLAARGQLGAARLAGETLLATMPDTEAFKAPLESKDWLKLGLAHVYHQMKDDASAIEMIKTLRKSQLAKIDNRFAAALETRARQLSR